ncbi:MAG: LysM peptidoglycan-binding domain-containing protein [Frankiaceae bacterium]
MTTTNALAAPSAPTMQQLADAMRAQASTPGHVVTVDGALLGRTDLAALLRAWLVRDDVKLVIDPSAIPASPPATGFTVRATLPGKDADTFFRLTDRDCTLTFVVSTVAGVTVVDFTLAVTPRLSAGATVPWTMGQSFGTAATLFDDVPFTSPTLTFSTYQVPGGVAPGLTFAAPVTLVDVLADVVKLLASPHAPATAAVEAATTTYQLSGQITQEHGGSAFNVKASLLTSGIPVGFVHISSPYVGLLLDWEQSTAPAPQGAPGAGGTTWRQAAALYVGADVTVTNSRGDKISESIIAVLPLTSGHNLMTFAVQPADGVVTSIGQLGELIAGNTWDDFFNGPASELKPYVDSFGLERLAVRAVLSNLTVASLTLQAGISKPWRFFDDLLVINSFTVLWGIIDPANDGPQSIIIDTELELLNDDDLVFDIEIALPGLVISGRYDRMVTFTLADLVTKVNSFFGVSLPVPPSDLATFSFGNFATTIDVPGKVFTLTGTTDVALRLFGLELLGLRDTVISITVDRNAGAKVPFAATLNGILTVLDIDFAVSASYGETIEFSIHLVDTNLGKLLNHLVHLVDPTYDISLPSPWSKLLDISLDALVLRISDSDTARKVSLTYETSIDLGFVDITGISLIYDNVQGAGSTVEITLDASFLGVPFGDYQGKPTGRPGLGWDAVNGAPPAVPNQGSKLFDLEYVGLGQHIAFDKSVDVSTMAKIMKALRDLAVPTQPGALPAFGGKGLVFDADSHWLIGAQFTVMDTVAISAIFNDPDLYGVLIQLSGEKAKIFAGLSFEILYRKVTDSIGVYHIELKLPDAMRHLEFGEVSVTLPVVVLDIYTNGNFRIDFGFPKGLDFSNSFSIQVFPFVGYGGFYFALLDGSTSSRVPQIVNGNWAPVIEFGVALSIGAGKTIDEGILSGGITVTVIGIVQGVLAWFNPSTPAPKETYYWIQGTIAIVGRLYATIDFAIIQASVDVTAYLSVTLTIEAHQPILIEATASVTVRVSLKIIFFTIHLSFGATIHASFVIGSATPTPWQLAGGSHRADPAVRRLRGMATLHAPAPRHVGSARAMRQLLAAPAAAPVWPAVLVLDQRRTVTVLATPSFTKAETWSIGPGGAVRAGGVTTITTMTAHDLTAGATVTVSGCDPSFDGTFAVTDAPSRTSFTYGQGGVADGTSGNGEVTAGPAADGAAAVLLLVVESSVQPRAATLAEQRALAGADPSSAPFNLLMEAMLRWGILAVTAAPLTPSGASRARGTVTLTTASPHGLAMGAGIVVAGVGDPSFDGSFTVASVPGPTSLTYAQTGADATSGNGVVAPATVTADALETLRATLTDDAGDGTAAAFDWDSSLAPFLAANFAFDVQPASTLTAETGGAVFPMLPELSLTDNQGLSVDFATAHPVGGGYAAKIQAYFTLLQAQIARRDGAPASRLDATATGPSAAEVVAGQYFRMLLGQGAKAAVDHLAALPYAVGDDAEGIAGVATAIGDPGLATDPMRVINPVQDKAVLATGATLDLDEVLYQVRTGDTYASIAAAFAAAHAEDPAGGAYATQSLMAANAGATGIHVPGAAVPIPGISYQTVAADTLGMISSRLLVRAAGAAVLNVLSGVQAQATLLLQANPGITDPTAALPAGLTVALPGGGDYTAAAGDTLDLVAAYLLALVQPGVDVVAYVTALLAANPSLTVTDPTAPQPVGTTIAMPAVTRVLVSGDSMSNLASLLMTDLATVQSAFAAVVAPVQLLAPHAVLHAPLRYPVQQGDTPAGIAATFDLALESVAAAAAPVAGLFAPHAALTIVDVPQSSIDSLVTGLLTDAAWNNAAGGVSRFFLSGLRLPDPTDPYFASLTVKDLLDPAKLAPVRTTAMLALTGQQYAMPPTAPSGYAITLTSSAPGWVTAGGQTSTTFGLSAAEQAMLTTFATTPLDPQVQAVGRLALYQMTPPRIVLGEHVAWQAGETVPLGTVPAAKLALRALQAGGAAGGGAAAPMAPPAAPPTGNPVVWPFPDPLLAEVSAIAAPSRYEVVVARHHDPDRAVAATQATRYSWATVVNIEIALPVTDGPTPSTAAAYVVNGADDTGAALLQALHGVLSDKTDTAELYLLYSPDPTSANRSGLVSDAVDRATTFLLKANLSTLGHPATRAALRAERAEGDDPTGVTAAAMSDPAGFVALLWEASVTRSGGFYLSYASDSGSPVPPSAFGTGSTAQLTLVAICGSHAANADAPLYAFTNAVVVGDNIDTATSSLFAQPATYSATTGGSLQAATDAVNAAWGLSLAPIDLATVNATVPQVLAPGTVLSVPGKSNYPVAYGDTLASAVTSSGAADLAALVNANLTVDALAEGAQLQLAAGVLRPATTVPPGMAGYELARTNPDPDNLPYDQLPPGDLVSSLFNMVGFSIAGSTGFLPSGAGLPTTPADSGHAGSDGLTHRDLSTSAPMSWNYQQALTVTPFASPAWGSASPALPPATANPYAGIAWNATTNELSTVTLALNLQDVYGNIQPMPSSASSVAVPVGYYDDVTNLAAWPSLAAGYVLVAGPPVAVELLLSMQSARYVPSASVPVGSARSAAAADLITYARAYYQLAQPDLTTTLTTNLSVDPGTGRARSYDLPKPALASFANGAYVYLAAMATMTPVTADVTDATTSLAAVAGAYGIPGGQLLAASADAPYDAVFAGQALVPQVYTVVHADTLTTIAAAFAGLGVDPATLVQRNAAIPVGAGTRIVTPARTVVATATSSLHQLAADSHGSVAGLATANGDATGLLAADQSWTYGTASYRTTGTERMSDVAANLGATVEQLAGANEWVAGLLVDQARLSVTDALAGPGDSLQSLAAAYVGGDLAALAQQNAATPDIWAPGTEITIGPKSAVTPAGPGDSITTFAASNGVTVTQLGDANAATGVTTLLAEGASLLVPGTLANDATSQYCVYRATGTDTLGDIAALFGVQAADIAALNPDLPGLLLAGQPVTDTASGTTVRTGDDATFDALVAALTAAGVQGVDVARVAGDVAGQHGLLTTGGLWICPPMRGDAHGANSGATLQGLADAYDSDLETVAASNAAVMGFLATGVDLVIGAVTVRTQQLDTLNSLVNRFAAQGVGTTVAGLATAFATTTGLVAAGARVAPVPPVVTVAPVPIQPALPKVAFPLAVDVVLARDPRLVDPAFTASPTVAAATCPIVPEPAPGANGGDLSLAAFAASVEAALPGVRVAVGDPPGEDDPPTARRAWAVNFGNPAGPAVTYSFDGPGTQYFALPPLSTALSGGTVDVTPYVSGEGLTGPAVPQAFHAVDLDVWLAAFATAVDTFLSPAQAVPAYALDPTSTTAVIGAKRRLAGALAARAAWVFDQTSGGSPADAVEAIRQALLDQLSNAFSVATIVQVPVSVALTDPSAGPKLNLYGQVVGAGSGGDLPEAYSFSTSSVALDREASDATILFSVKAPADHRSASIALDYRVNAVELPTPGATIDGYQGSQWLTFVTSPQSLGGSLGTLDIPVPLRSYPGPVALAAQTAAQSIAKPASAIELLPWNLSFIWTHDDAEQDSSLLQVTFNPGGVVQGRPVGNQADAFSLATVLAALAKFTAVYPALRADLALLPGVAPGTPNATAAKAVGALATLVGQVADAFDPAPRALGDFAPTSTTYYYLLQKQQDPSTGKLTTLTVTSIGATNLLPAPNPTALWPDVHVTWDGTEVPLAMVGTPTSTQATYAYPAGTIDAAAPLPQRLCYAWPGAGTVPPPVPPRTADLTAPQVVQFVGTDVLSMQSARAGVAIVRNLSLVTGTPTNPAFVYQTPLTNFTSVATASVTGTTPITIGSRDPSGPSLAEQVAIALGDFLHDLLWARDTWQPADRLPARLAAGYSYPVATGTDDTTLDALVPVLLAPSVDLDPSTDCGPAEGTFVRAVADQVQTWYDSAQPPAGYLQFDVVLYASLGTLQPLVEATALRFSLG